MAMVTRESIEKTLRAYAAAWGAKDRDAWLGTFALDATQEDPVGGVVRRGRAEIGAFWDAAMASYGSLEISVCRIVIVGREAAMVWCITATTPDGEVRFDGVDVFRLDEDALIASVRAYWERKDVRRQLDHEAARETANRH